ncbi:MAG: outer membrane lipoprotein-sorting protein [Pseudomonadota bacterium]
MSNTGAGAFGAARGNRRWPAVAAFLLMAGAPLRAQDPASAALPDLSGLSPAQQGLTIFREKDRRESGYGDLQVDVTMVLRDQQGSQSRRELSMSQLEMEDEGDRLLVVFETPKPIRGTALLSYSHVTEPDEQWLYLPAMRRVKRIASRDKSGPFLSSEFAYEDLALEEVEKYDYEMLGRESCGERTCLRVERIPRDEYSGYSRQEVLLDERTLRVERIEYFDRHERPLKVLEHEDYELYQEQYWKPGRMKMENLQTGKSTVLRWEAYRFDTGLLPDRDFSTNSLERAR